MTKLPNPPPGSTRKELNEEEKEWLKQFDRATMQGDRQALKKLQSEANSVAIDKVQAEIDDERYANRQDVFNAFTPLHADPKGEAINDYGYEEALQKVIDSPSNNERVDKTANPKKDMRNKRYTPDDYAPPTFPNEDTIVAAIDIDTEREMQAKVKHFPVKKKEKKNDQAS